MKQSEDYATKKSSKIEKEVLKKIKILILKMTKEEYNIALQYKVFSKSEPLKFCLWLGDLQHLKKYQRLLGIKFDLLVKRAITELGFDLKISLHTGTYPIQFVVPQYKGGKKTLAQIQYEKFVKLQESTE